MNAAQGEPRPMMVSLPIRVKTYDIDVMGHVNNIVYIRWLEDLRTHFLDVHLPLGGLLERGVGPVIVATEIHYRQGITLSDHEVQGRMWVKEFGKAVFRLGADFRVGEDLRCTAVQRGTFVDMTTMRPIRIPSELNEIYISENGSSK